MYEGIQDIIVKEPETNEQYNCSEIVRKLYAIYLKDSKNLDEFKKYLSILHSAIGWNDNMENDIKVLGSILKEYGLGSRFEEQLNKINLRTLVEDKEYLPISEKYKSSYFQLKKEKGISLLNEEIDKRTNGISPGTICTIAGGPGTLKTTYAMNISYNALLDNKNVCYISLEESPTQLFSKLMSRVSIDMYGKSPLEVSDIINGNLSEDMEHYLLNDVLQHFLSLDGQFDMIGENDLISLDFKSIEAKLKQIDDYMKKHGNNRGIDLIVVDHIQLFKFVSDDKDEKSTINSYVSFFRKQSLSFLGEDRQVAIILLSQVNREGIKRSQGKETGKYLMSEIAEASEIERSSTYIITTYTDAMKQLERHIHLGVLKLRNGELPASTIVDFAEGAYYQVGYQRIPETMDYKMPDIMADKLTLDTF